MNLVIEKLKNFQKINFLYFEAHFLLGNHVWIFKVEFLEDREEEKLDMYY